MLSRERRLFFLRWLRNPHHIGVPIPSSKSLAKAVAAQLSAVSEDEHVVELGPGTGVITHAICNFIDPKKLVLVDRDHRFIERLRHEFPQTTVLQGDARQLKEILEKQGISQVAAVVSSLPLLSMPDNICHTIVNTAFEVIKSDGMFVQYTYGPASPVAEKHQRSIGIHGKLMKRVWRNFPPAKVWCYRSESPL